MSEKTIEEIIAEEGIYVCTTCGVSMEPLLSERRDTVAVSPLSERAKKYELLLVPGDDFGCGGYVRIAYCVTTEQIKNSLPAFKKLAEDYKSGK